MPRTAYDSTLRVTRTPACGRIAASDCVADRVFTAACLKAHSCRLTLTPAQVYMRTLGRAALTSALAAALSRLPLSIHRREGGGGLARAPPLRTFFS
jgi:hypothetical protein